MGQDRRDHDWSDAPLFRPLTPLERIRCGGTESDDSRRWRCVLREVAWDPECREWRCAFHFEGRLAVN